MGIIKILPETVANKIAAGEVIERPASIVKELVENALDAGARSIEIIIHHGGKSLIRVADDGYGMSADDAEIAFQRYATSKIKNADDLHQIESYGFRGEALPSIAAVSRVKLQTRAKGKDSGTEIVIEGGQLVSAKEAACQKGTAIEVRDLFFNTPARRKFMKSDTSEMGQIHETISNISLSRLDVGFVLKVKDKAKEKTELNLPAGQTAMARATAILGEDLGKNLLKVDAKTSGIEIHGLIGKPNIARANRSSQIFFINGRWVKSTSLSYGLQAGYHGLLMHGQFPVAVIFIQLDLQRVDVNVHPAKMEVRISNEAEIKSLLQEAVSRRLSEEGTLGPELKVTPKSFTPVPLSVERREFSEFSRRTADSPHRELGLAEPPVHFASRPAAVAEEVISLRDKLKITRVLGQIHQTFLIAETDEGLMIIDQHAAHERINYEAVLKNFQSAEPVRQGLLMQEIMEVLPKHRDALLKALPFLQKAGFDIESFGEKSFAIRAVPAILHEDNPASLIQTFLEEVEDGKIKTGLGNFKEEAAALIACKRKSVKAYDALTPEAVRNLIERLARCENPFSCPHGRPTFLKYSFLDLEKQFKRK